MLSLLGRQVSQSARPTACFSLGSTQRRTYAARVSLFDDLTHRGFIQHVTKPQALQVVLNSKNQVVYAGVDPTAKSLHIGHLIPLMCLFHFQIHGHKIIPLIGGATGRIGDPSGRFSEREPAKIKQVEANVASLTESIRNFFHRAILYADTRVVQTKDTYIDPAIISNLEWHKGFNMLDFLQKVGIHARVNTMLNKESVRARLNSQQGLSFTEFTYQLLQAYDFYHLHKHLGCTIQVGGSDQWGNILAGIELIGRLDHRSSTPDSGRPEQPPDAFGITTPLLTTSSGEKFGKSAGNAVWLDSTMTSVFDFYQYFVKVDDADVEKHLKLFTLLSWSKIAEVMSAHAEQPEKRMAQKCLAAEVTEMVHTSDGLARAQTLTNLLFESDYSNLKADRIISTFEGDPRLIMIDEKELFQLPAIKLAAKYGLVSSISVSRKLLLSRGLYLNNNPIPEPQFLVTKAQLIDDRVAILRAGKDKLIILATTTAETTCNLSLP